MMMIMGVLQFINKRRRLYKKKRKTSPIFYFLVLILFIIFLGSVGFFNLFFGCFLFSDFAKKVFLGMCNKKKSNSNEVSGAIARRW